MVLNFRENSSDCDFTRRSNFKKPPVGQIKYFWPHVGRTVRRSRLQALLQFHEIMHFKHPDVSSNSKCCLQQSDTRATNSIFPLLGAVFWLPPLPEGDIWLLSCSALLWVHQLVANVSRSRTSACICHVLPILSVTQRELALEFGDVIHSAPEKWRRFFDLQLLVICLRRCSDMMLSPSRVHRLLTTSRATAPLFISNLFYIVPLNPRCGLFCVLQAFICLLHFLFVNHLCLCFTTKRVISAPLLT